VLLGCLACDSGAAEPADQRPVRHFATHCDYAVLPNFVAPLKSIAARSDLALDMHAPDAADTMTLATLAAPKSRISVRFGQPRANDVTVSLWAWDRWPDRAEESAYGRIVALFRFCDQTS